MSEQAPEGGAPQGQVGGEAAPPAGSDPQNPQQGSETDPAKWKALSRKHEADAEKWRVQAEQHAAAAKELAALKRGQQTEAERLSIDLKTVTSERDTLSTQVTDLQVEIARLKAGIETGLSTEDLERFVPRGTPEEMLTAAKALAARLNPQAPPNPDGGPRTPAGRAPTMSDLIRAQLAAKRGIR
jgi:hypothetical protein